MDWPGMSKRGNLIYSTQNVYNIFERCLPMRGIKVRAYDIDTYDDYTRVSKIIKDWNL